MLFRDVASLNSNNEHIESPASSISTKIGFYKAETRSARN